MDGHTADKPAVTDDHPVVIVGGDAAGMSAASKLKRERPDREVIVFEKGDWVSYGACGLPYYIKGEVESLSDLVSIPPEKFRSERGIDLRTNHEVVEIDTESREVTVERHEEPDNESGTETITQPYGTLLIATGARAVEPPFDGMELDGVFTLHEMDAAKEIREYLGLETGGDSEAAVNARSVAIVGGGYVGIEMAEAFAAHGLEVHLYEMLPHVLQPFGEETAEVVENHLDEQGIDLHLETAVEGFLSASETDTVETAETDDKSVAAIEAGGQRMPVDMVLVGVGVVPNVEIAETAGIETGSTGAIATDEYGETNVEGVYAAGDCAEARHVVTDEPDHVPLALTANRAGRAIGSTLAGEPTPVGPIAGTAVLKAFDLEVARTGVIDPERARSNGFDPVSVTISAPTRAHYYPGGVELQVTLVADAASNRVLGASIVGEEGAAKRIDTVATALSAELTVPELEKLDLSYAPPFSPVWDPVLTAAKVLNGKLEPSGG
ncbi:pyridine nucleotide-disulfide oxidoreductase [Halalkaliarchaeum desulfuricum]|uniref:Pyridine nucleotide-disulfide oxidoreductase n=1 Tax=Halalkaliarchaeum desulfuricum TaxID=2055893 RepID=A0A343TKD7_9EURY|nr:FAD-dependent oxidoreductase [Halalkaliarchaeum desulfuricum]AUX09559.1 pyridine nucleotide-disulfide oxidoreductase [Halalkaliarchaeum desulfuricum]